MELSNKKAIITGASRGLGLVIAENFVREGADIIICSTKSEEIVLNEKIIFLNEILVRPNQVVTSICCDVSNKKEMDYLFDAALKELKDVDILVNNAGIYGPMGESENVDFELWSESIKINLLAPFYLSQKAIQHYKKKQSGKIINLSGGGATKPLPFICSYATAKAAVVRMTETMAEEVKPFGIDINAIAPGALNTRLLDEVLMAGAEMVGSAFYQKALLQKEKGGDPLYKGAELCVFLASEKSNGISGKLISAIWDRWEDWPNHLEELQQSDVYTLRRITGRDRDMNWGDK